MHLDRDQNYLDQSVSLLHFSTIVGVHLASLDRIERLLFSFPLVLGRLLAIRVNIHRMHHAASITDSGETSLCVATIIFLLFSVDMLSGFLFDSQVSAL